MAAHLSGSAADEGEVLSIGDASGGGEGRRDAVTLKLLLDNQQCGIVIGRGGINRVNVQNAFGIKLQCSRPGEFYPGSQDRVVWLSGPALAQLTAALDEVLRLLYGDAPSTLRLVLPMGVAGVVIGLGGSVQQELTALSGAMIHFNPAERQVVMSGVLLTRVTSAVTERTVTISGTRSQVVKAALLMLDKVVDLLAYAAGGYEPAAAAAAASAAAASAAQAAAMAFPQPQLPAYHGMMSPQSALSLQPQHALVLPPGQRTVLSPYPAMMYSAPSHTVTPLLPLAPPPAGLHGGLSMGPVGPIGGMASLPAGTAEVSFEVPDNRIGIIIGKGGATLEGLKRLLSVRITVSRRDATAGPGPPMRRVTVAGAAADVATAQYVMMQKLQTFTARRGGRHSQQQQLLKEDEGKPQEHTQLAVESMLAHAVAAGGSAGPG